MELIELFNGIPIQNSLDESHKILKAYLAFVTADLDARTKLQKMVGFNGYFGCFYCKLKGEYIKEKNMYISHQNTTTFQSFLEIHLKLKLMQKIYIL